MTNKMSDKKMDILQALAESLNEELQREELETHLSKQDLQGLVDSLVEKDRSAR